MKSAHSIANGDKDDIKIGILHSVNGFFVTNEGSKKNPSFHVWIPTLTHSIVDSAYEDLSIAVVRCNYISKDKNNQ